MRFSILIIATVLGFGLMACSPPHSHNEKNKPLEQKALTDGDFLQPLSEEEVELGRLLFFDKILSGNKNISCATCHHPTTGSSDGLALGIGEGGKGLGPERSLGEGADAVEERVPRNSPAIFNLGHKDTKVLFHDGRVSKNAGFPSGFKTPAGQDLQTGLRNILAAQAMFPVTSPTEMAGQEGENEDNEVAEHAADEDFNAVWDALAARIRKNSKYVKLFSDVYDDISKAEDIEFSDIANAIAAFEMSAFKAGNSPYDRFLNGDENALTEKQIKGKELFFGKAQCVSCHSGSMFTDQEFHAVGFPQIGQGKGDGIREAEDYGRERVTNSHIDRYKFRTPSLRNAELTGPYGHAGTFRTLEDVISYHVNEQHEIQLYTLSQVDLPSRKDLDKLDFIILEEPEAMQSIARASTMPKNLGLTDEEMSQLVAFVKSLTDDSSRDLEHLVPSQVPSGLEVSD